jgi:hypothetical protein
MIELRFPANIGGRRYKFDVIREGRHVDIFPDHPWISKVVSWAQEQSKDPIVAIPTQIQQIGQYRLRNILEDKIPGICF